MKTLLQKKKLTKHKSCCYGYGDYSCGLLAFKTSGSIHVGLYRAASADKDRNEADSTRMIDLPEIAPNENYVLAKSHSPPVLKRY
jgi:hypothetical protein